MTSENMMDLDDMRTAWRALNRRVEESVALQRELLAQIKIGKAHSAVRRLAWVQGIELALNVVAALLVGSFIAAHLSEPRFAVPAIVLQAVIVFAIATDVWQLERIRRTDFSASVVTLQSELARLRAARLRITRWLLIGAPLLWTPLVIIAARGLVGVDVYRPFGWLWVAANVAVGVVVIPLAIWISRHYSERLRGSRALKRVSDDLAGRSLATALGFLDELSEFEKE